MIIAWLIKIGLSEATAIAVVGCKWCRRVGLAIVIALAMLLGAWYLTHIGGDWREAEIRRQWSHRFAVLTNESRRLAIERARANADVARAVREAIQALPVTVEVSKCELPIDAVKRLNKIR